MKDLVMYKKGKASNLVPFIPGNPHDDVQQQETANKHLRIDLNDYVSKYPEATFFAKVKGDSMIGSGIFPDDILVVDSSLEEQNGDVVVGELNGEFILRSYFKKDDKVYLMPDNQYYKAIELTEDSPFVIFGVVPYTIYSQRRRNSARVNRLEQFLR